MKFIFRRGVGAVDKVKSDQRFNFLKVCRLILLTSNLIMGKSFGCLRKCSLGCVILLSETNNNLSHVWTHMMLNFSSKTNK